MANKIAYDPVSWQGYFNGQNGRWIEMDKNGQTAMDKGNGGGQLTSDNGQG